MTAYTSTTPAELIWQDFRAALITGQLSQMGQGLPPADTAVIDFGHLLDDHHPDYLPHDLLTRVRTSFGELLDRNGGGAIHLPHPWCALLDRYTDADGGFSLVLIIGIEVDTGTPIFLCYGHVDGAWYAPGSFALVPAPEAPGLPSRYRVMAAGWAKGRDPTPLVAIMFAALSLLFAKEGVEFTSRTVPVPRGRKKPHPLAPKHVVTIRVNQPRLLAALTSPTPFATTPRQIAGHMRSGCYVTYRSGKVGWRRPTAVNGGISPSAYRVAEKVVPKARLSQSPSRGPSGAGTSDPTRDVVDAVLATYQGEEMARDVTLGFGRSC